MAKQITFEYDGKKYVLEFTRRSVTQMEQNGFVADQLAEKPMIMLPMLFAGAFLANHRFVRQDQITAMYNKFTNRSELLAKLIEMYNEPIAALIDEPDEDDSGKVEWTFNG